VHGGTPSPPTPGRRSARSPQASGHLAKRRDEPWEAPSRFCRPGTLLAIAQPAWGGGFIRKMAAHERAC